MLPGKNTNVVHDGKLYHVQTEDSGVKRPHIITLLYHGGTIVSSRKTSYADIVNSEYMEQVVEEIIEEQHNQMIADLKSGAFDKPGAPPAAKKTVDAIILNPPVSEKNR
jgi:hypothetical protein